MHFDMPLDELRDYRPTVDEPDDFDDYWEAEMSTAAEHPLDVELEAVRSEITTAHVFDVRFSGHGGARIAAWLLVPMQPLDGSPVVVEFVGYNGGRGRPLDWLTWISAGFVHLVVDNRGQGGGWRGGDTPDPGDRGEPGGQSRLGRGLADPRAHYCTRLYVDAARAIAAVAETPGLGGRQVLSVGASQGGAMAIAAAALSRGAAAVIADVPFLAHIRRAVSITDEQPYAEIADHCRLYPDRVDQAFRTLSYFDVVNHAKRVDAPGMFGVGLVDTITPPSTVFAAYNSYGGDKQIMVYEFNGHDSGGTLHTERKISFAHSFCASTTCP